MAERISLSEHRDDEVEFLLIRALTMAISDKVSIVQFKDDTAGKIDVSLTINGVEVPIVAALVKTWAQLQDSFEAKVQEAVDERIRELSSLNRFRDIMDETEEKLRTLLEDAEERMREELNLTVRIKNQQSG
jgi:3-polyprenyl-4-hydroxybenzoate decarboxylase